MIRDKRMNSWKWKLVWIIETFFDKIRLSASSSETSIFCAYAHHLMNVIGALEQCIPSISLLYSFASTFLCLSVSSAWFSPFSILVCHCKSSLSVFVLFWLRQTIQSCTCETVYLFVLFCRAWSSSGVSQRFEPLVVGCMLHKIIMFWAGHHPSPSTVDTCRPSFHSNKSILTS